MFYGMFYGSGPTLKTNSPERRLGAGQWSGLAGQLIPYTPPVCFP
jgi:hypothetical protein